MAQESTIELSLGQAAYSVALERVKAAVNCWEKLPAEMRQCLLEITTDLARTSFEMVVKKLETAYYQDLALLPLMLASSLRYDAAYYVTVQELCTRMQCWPQLGVIERLRLYAANLLVGYPWPMPWSDKRANGEPRPYAERVADGRRWVCIMASAWCGRSVTESTLNLDQFFPIEPLRAIEITDYFGVVGATIFAMNVEPVNGESTDCKLGEQLYNKITRLHQLDKWLESLGH